MKNKAASRLLLDMNRWGIDVFDEFGRYDYVNTQTILPTHTHPGMIEICYLAKGSQKYFVGDRKYRLYGGDLFVTFPDEVHGTGEVPEEKGVLYWLVLKRPEAGKDYMGLDYADACSLFAKLSELPERQFKGGAECGCLLRKIVQLFYSDRDELTIHQTITLGTDSHYGNVRLLFKIRNAETKLRTYQNHACTFNVL